MADLIHRRDWLKQGSLAALGLGISIGSMANEDMISREFGRETGLINLGSNENPYGISSKAIQAIKEMTGQANRYSFNVSSLQNFSKQVAAKYSLNEQDILITPGSGDALVLLARYFSGGNIVAGNPTFGILPNTAKRLGTTVKEIQLTPGKVHDLAAMLAAIDASTRLVYIVNPANPTGTIVSPAVLKDFCTQASKSSTVLVDEAYFDYIDTPNNESMLSLIHSNPRIIVMRTFSKIHGMAGLRVGFIAAHPDLIKKLEDSYFSNSSYCLNTLAMTAALASLDDEQHGRDCKQKNDAARNYTVNELTKLGYNCIPSSTNFLFFGLKNYAGDFGADMLKKNILLRSYDHPDGKWARVSIGTMEEMRLFCAAMKSVTA